MFRSGLARQRGVVLAGLTALPCALGATGLTRRKREGDKATPVSRLHVLGAFYRPDRLPRPHLLVPTRRLRQGDGWCDAPASRRYNRPVRLPFGASHERMWRDDALYDLVLDLSWNRELVRPGRGSAIFLHSARPGFGATEGCVAVARSRIARLASCIGPATAIEIRDSGSPVRKVRR